MNNSSDLLAEIQANYAASSPTETIAGLNAKTIAAKTPIPAIEVKRYLRAVRKMTAIELSVLSIAKEFIGALQDIPSFDTENTTYNATITAVLDELISAELIASGDKTAILALADINKSWSDINWGRDVELYDLQAAGVL